MAQNGTQRNPAGLLEDIERVGRVGSNPRPADYENARLLPWLPHQRLCRSNCVSTPPVRPFRRIPIATVIARRSDDGSNGSDWLAYRSHTSTKYPVTRRDQNLGSLRYTTTAPDPSMRPLPRSLPVNSAMTNGTICRTLLISPAVSAAPEGTLWCHGRDHALHAAALY